MGSWYFGVRGKRKTPLTMTISSVLPQLFGCRASVTPGLFVRPVLRPGPFPSFFGPACSIHRAPGVACSGPWTLHPDLARFTSVDCIKSAPDSQGATRHIVRPDLATIRHPADRRNTGKGRTIPDPRRGPSMICKAGGRGSLSGSVFVVSGAGACCPALQDIFNPDPVRDRRGL